MSPLYKRVYFVQYGEVISMDRKNALMVARLGADGAPIDWTRFPHKILKKLGNSNLDEETGETIQEQYNGNPLTFYPLDFDEEDWAGAYHYIKEYCGVSIG